MNSPKKLLSRWHLRAKQHLGQHFLIHPSTTQTLVARAGVGIDEVVLEIGAGLGALSIALGQAAKQVYAVEKDKELVPLLNSELQSAGVENVEIIEGDILGMDLFSFMEAADHRLVVMGNLPYNISSQILVRLIHARQGVSRAVLMFQKELAERISARPGKKDYGRLSVMLQYCARVRPVMTIGAGSFFPVPKIDSQVIEIDFTHPPEIVAMDETVLFQVVKAAFSKRRKTLRNSLSGSDYFDTPQSAAAMLGSVDIDPIRRAETLTVEEFVRLADAVSRKATGC